MLRRFGSALRTPAVPGVPTLRASIANYSPGPGVTAGSGFGIPGLLLCVPGGSLHVVTLGVQGSVTASFDFPITDGPGTDFVAWENGFVSGGVVFGELGFVEVSTNGVDFARFPNQYFGPPGPIGAFGGLPAGSVKNIAGLGLRVVPPTVDGYANPALAGGDPFDLQDLAADPLVVAGTVVLSAINYVRIVDILGDGTTLDSLGAPIYDPTGGTASSDWDAIAVVNNTANQDANRPAITVSFDADDPPAHAFGERCQRLDDDHGRLAFDVQRCPLRPRVDSDRVSLSSR